MRFAPSSILLAMAIMAVPYFLCGQSYTDVSTVQGIDLITPANTYAHGVSFVDIDKDGWDDLTFARQDSTPAIYLNNEGILVPANFEFEGMTLGNMKAVLWVDFDNDNDRDLITSSFGTPVQIFENDGDFNFTEVGQDMGILQQEVDIFGISCADFDNNGWLDLYVCKFDNNPGLELYEMINHLYLNDGNGNLQEIAIEAGVDDGVKPSFQSVALDLNKDGWQDIHIINDRYQFANSYYENQGDSTFTNVAPLNGLDISRNFMSNTIGDIDNDLDLDIYMSNTADGNFLMRNDDLQFEDISAQSNTQTFKEGWGCSFLDYDNNGLLDLYVQSVAPAPGFIELNNFYRNNGDGTFTDIQIDIGLDQDISRSFAVAVGDLDNDGYPDFGQGAISPSFCKLYQNSGGVNNYIAFTLQGLTGNTEGIGSWITIHHGDSAQVRYVLAGENYIGQNSYRQLFGLGNIEQIDSVHVEWSGGQLDTYYNLVADSTYHLIENIYLAGEIETQNNLLCPGDSTLLFSNEGFINNWSTGDTSQTIWVHEAGLYHANFITEFGMEYASDTLEVIVQESPDFSAELQHVSCFGLSDGIVSIIDLTDAVDSIYLDGMPTVMPIEGLSAGGYTITLLDTLGCTFDSTFLISQPEALSASISQHLNDEGNPALIAEVQGGTPPYSFLWSDQGIVQNEIEVSESDVYVVQITDSIGCTVSAEFAYTGIDTLGAQDFLIYPNPSKTGWINIQSPLRSINYRISSIDGRTVSSGFIDQNNERILISDHKGIFILQLIAEEFSGSFPIFIRQANKKPRSLQSEAFLYLVIG